jgi:hypothetical protein
LRPEAFFSAVPRHTTCQVCKEEFKDYFEHVDSRKHKRMVDEALGSEFIRDTIQDYQMAIFDENNEEDLVQLTELCLSLKESVPPLR